jgi:hypothetical protein
VNIDKLIEKFRRVRKIAPPYLFQKNYFILRGLLLFSSIDKASCGFLILLKKIIEAIA